MSQPTQTQPNSYGLTDQEVGTLRLFHLCVIDQGAGALLLLKAVEQFAHDPQACAEAFEGFMEARAYQELGTEMAYEEEPADDESIVTSLVMLFPRYKPVFEACEPMLERCVPALPVFAAVTMALQDLAGEEEITDENQHFDLDRIIGAAVSLRFLVDLAHKVNNETAFPTDALPSDDLLYKIEVHYADQRRRVMVSAMGLDPDSLRSLPRPADAIPNL